MEGVTRDLEDNEDVGMNFRKFKPTGIFPKEYTLRLEFLGINNINFKVSLTTLNTHNNSCSKSL